MLKTLTRRFQNLAPQYTSGRRSFVIPSGAGSAGMASSLSAYKQNGLVFQIVSRHAAATAEATWQLYRKGSDEPVSDSHPAAALWRKPNAHMDQSEFIEMSAQHFILAGECVWNVARNGLSTMPLELWPVRPDHVEPVPHPTLFIEGWAYRNPDGQWVPWRVDQVIQTKQPDPENPYRGYGAIAAAIQDLYGERAASEYNNAFFRNDASAGDIIRFPDRITDEQFDEFVARWNEQHQGVANSNKIGIIEMAEYQFRPHSLRDMQFEELRKLNREFIREAHGYPKAMLGSTEDVNKAAALAGALIFKDRIVRPTLERLRTSLNTKLLPMFGTMAADMEFRYETPDIADEELALAQENAKYAHLGELIRGGFDPAESLAMLGLKPVKHLGLPPVTVQPDYLINPPDAPQSQQASPRRASDPAAKAIWERAQQMREERPSMTWEAISGFLGVSERTLRRYQAEFRAD